MSTFIIVSGKKLKNEIATTKTNAQKNTESSDRAALRAASKARREQREKRMRTRDSRKTDPKTEVKNYVKSTTNVIARKYGLVQPNNPEALAHDRLHCITCDRELHIPDAHEDIGVESLFDDDEVRMLCCWCFGKMGDDEIKDTMKTGLEATAEIRLRVYNPEESTELEIEGLTDSRLAYLKSKLRRWEQTTALIGNLKHDYLTEGDAFENHDYHQNKTRYDSCTL